MRRELLTRYLWALKTPISSHIFNVVRAEALQKFSSSRMSEANPRQPLVKGERLIRYELASAMGMTRWFTLRDSDFPVFGKRA